MIFIYRFVQNKWLISFYNKLFEHFDYVLSSWPIMPFYIMCEMQNYNSMHKDKCAPLLNMVTEEGVKAPQ